VLVRTQIQMTPEAGGWSASLPGTPIAADGATRDEAIDEMARASRDTPPTGRNACAMPRTIATTMNLSS
jgi:hypothetical protein